MAHRKMVDVSGDQRETVPREYVVLLPRARTMANALGVTISGLVITNADPDLLSYCRAAVPTGDGNFAMQATDYVDFAVAMKRKLLHEIENHPSISKL